MKKLIVLVAGLMISTGAFAKTSDTCNEQASIAAQGLANANPNYHFGRLVLESIKKEQDSEKIYKYTPSNNDGYIEVKTSPDTSTTCYVYSVNLFMP
ncbi:MAG: hypothetical protein ACXVCE_12585 [Bacteriovorax sp.]